MLEDIGPVCISLVCLSVIILFGLSILRMVMVTYSKVIDGRWNEMTLFDYFVLMISFYWIFMLLRGGGEQ